MSRRKAHVVEERWIVGGFSPVRHVKCRCGWQAKHYNARALKEIFRAHQTADEAS